MRIYLDIDSRRLFSAPGRPLSKLEFKRRDNDEIELIFLRDDTVQELAVGTIAKIGVKVNADWQSVLDRFYAVEGPGRDPAADVDETAECDG